MVYSNEGETVCVDVYGVTDSDSKSKANEYIDYPNDDELSCVMDMELFLEFVLVKPGFYSIAQTKI